MDGTGGSVDSAMSLSLRATGITVELPITAAHAKGSDFSRCPAHSNEPTRSAWAHW
jgi:hypothetical protein